MDKIERFVELLSEGDEKISLGFTDDDSGHLPSKFVDHRPHFGRQKMILLGNLKWTVRGLGSLKEREQMVRYKTGRSERT